MKKLIRPPMMVLLGLLVAVTGFRSPEVTTNVRADFHIIYELVSELRKYSLHPGNPRSSINKFEFIISESDFVVNDLSTRWGSFLR
ncbi:MAG: hypothetical protein R8G66_07805 [Cytophagales bacterium]|nr:hypothetical protein [Cytophagales bacterium]